MEMTSMPLKYVSMVKSVTLFAKCFIKFVVNKSSLSVYIFTCVFYLLV